MDFSTIGSLICGEETPSFLGTFDFSTAPQLLFYSYIPIIIISALIGFYVYFKDKKSLQSKLLLFVVGFFVLWVLNILIQWVASYHILLMFAWQLTAIFEVGLFLTTAYFAYVFINKKNLPFLGKLILWILGLTAICLTSTKLNISSYDLQNCEGVVGPLWNILYAFEPAIIISIIYMGFVALRKEEDKLLRNQIILFTSGLSFFLTTFFIFNFYGELTRVYEFNLWGPIGMVVFFIFLGYMIVKFHTFNIKLFATQVLVFGLAALIGTQFFFIKVPINFLLTGVTFIASIIFGYFLIRSVKKEIQQKEELEKLTAYLETANEKLKSLDNLKTEFLSLVTHQLRSPIAAIKGYSSMLLDGSYGSVTEKQKDPADKIFKSSERMNHMIVRFLDVAKIEKGGMQYTMQSFELGKMAEEIVNELSVTAKERGLTITFETDNKSPYMINADKEQVWQVVQNLIDNSIKYTKTGWIKVKLLKDEKENKIILSVSDSGMGIKPEILPLLFQKFSRGEGGKMNADGSGIGLYLAKDIIENGHHGKIWAESEGAGKGSVFTFELPLDFENKPSSI